MHPFRFISNHNPLVCYPRTVMVIVLILLIAAAERLSAQVPESSETRHSAGLVEKMKQWQNAMSDKFSETFNTLRKDNKSKEQAIAMVSVNLREKIDSYILRLNLPDRDLAKVEVTLENDSLSITVPAEGKAARYQQTIVLTGIAAGTKPVVERLPKQNLMVVTIPKSAAATGGTGEHERPAAAAPLDDWDRDVLDRMDRMHEEMNRIFESAFKDINTLPEDLGFVDEPRFGSSFVVQDEGYQYVIRAYLPERDLKDLKVTVEGKVLKIEAQAESTETKEDQGTTSNYKAEYAQAITLPGPVLKEKMQVERKDGMVVVTLPKTTAIR
jgi:HSP20 family protein